ncbi:hypothetical protein NQ176_g4556 [Zarea fungicola]|uniref:Uncharacterized protein n=1 Tax=Zarea fungicola TaxID=93591 RepID=A0ACC1NDR6_9HYPO|nr:hypothetical protein NQ176_g4556 [Lecanicillium fungicola]
MASTAASSFSGSNTAPLESQSPDDTDRTVEVVDPEPSWHEKDGWIFIRAFTPAWFTVNMGTGIASVLLHNLPYNGAWLYWLSVIVFVLNIALFILFTGITIMRYFLYPGLWTVMMHHPVQPLFLGAFPIALATIVEMIALVCVPAWGPWAATLAWALWWIDAAISIVACYSIPFFM